MPIELVVFDMAGTTVADDDAVNSCFRAALAGAGVVVQAAEVTPYMGYPKPEAIRLILAGRGRIAAAEEIAPIHDDFVARMQRDYETSPEVSEIPGAAAAFALLRKRGVKIALNSGFNRVVVDAIVARLGWGPLIDADMASGEAPRGRPHPDMILRLMDRLGVRRAENVAKVGDTPSDLAEGTSAGCGMVVGVCTGSFTREELAAHPHTHLVESVADVPALLASR